MATRKRIIEATSQIIGQKEVSIMPEDRGPLDLTRRIDDLAVSYTHLTLPTILLV